LVLAGFQQNETSILWSLPQEKGALDSGEKKSSHQML
jgi:hypothetical protein